MVSVVGWITGTGVPPSSLGFNGDFYIDTTNTYGFYGPKSGGVWPAQQLFANQKQNSAATAPAAANDNTQGFSVGSIWVNTVTNDYFVAEDVTTGAAVWVRIYQLDTNPGTAAPGYDSRIVNAVQSTLIAGKGDLLVGTAAGVVSHLAVGADTTVLTADSSQTTGMKWAPATGSGGATFPLSGYGLLAASGDPISFQNPQSLANGTIFGARCWVPANTALSHLAAAIQTGGTFLSSAVPNQLGIYDDTGVQLQTTSNDSTLWATAGWGTGAITTITAQATGRFVYILYIIGGFSGVAVPYALGANDSNAPWLGRNVSNAGNRRAFFLSGQTALPLSFNPTSVGTNTGFIPLVGAY